MDIFFDLLFTLFDFDTDTTLCIFGMFGNIIGSGISSSQASEDAQLNREWQTKERLATQEWQEKMMDKSNEMQRGNQQWSYDKFDSPLAQKQNMQAAGMNPFVEGSVLEPASSSAMGAPSAPSGSAMSVPQQSGNKYLALMQMGQSVGEFLDRQVAHQKARAETELIQAQTTGQLLKNIEQNDTNSLFETRKSLMDQDLISKKFNNQILEIETKFKEQNEILDQEQRRQGLLNLKAQFDLLKSQGKKTKSEIQVLNAYEKKLFKDLKVADSQIEVNEAEAELKRALTMTENDLRNLKRSEFEENIQLIRGHITKNATEVEIKEIEKKLDQLDYDYFKTVQGMRLYQDVAKTVWDIIPVNALGGIIGGKKAGKGRK